MTKSRNLKIFKCQYLSDIFRYGPDVLHVIITFIGFKITFSNMGSFSSESEMSPLTGLSRGPPKKNLNFVVLN